MKDYKGEIQYKGKTYHLVFNLNVMEMIQDEYGKIETWAELTDANEVVRDKKGEPKYNADGSILTQPKEVDAKALKFGMWCMMNEGIEIDNEENGTDVKPLTKSQVGRILSEYGLENATATVNETVIKSSKSEEKN